MIRKPALFTLSAVIICSSHAVADDLPVIVKLNESAQQAFDQGKFRKAEASWTRTIKAMQENGENDSFLETCLKRLGQTYMRLERTVEAYRALSQALVMCRQLNLQDAELAQELTDLSKTYRPIDVSELGDGTAKALKKANVTSVGLVKTNTGSMMRVDLPEKFEKQLDSDVVDGLSFDKAVTLNMAEDSDGTVSLTNIQGLRIHAKEKNMWVNLLQAVIKPADAKGEHPADVTAGKMGVTKTVSASLPAKGFEPLNGMLKQLRLMGTPVPVAFTGAGEPATVVSTAGSPVAASVVSTSDAAASGGVLAASAAPSTVASSTTVPMTVIAPAAPVTAEASMAATAAAAPSEATDHASPSGAPIVVAADLPISPASPAIVNSDQSKQAIVASPQTAESRPANLSCDKLFAETEKLVKIYYPRAKFKRTGNKLHFEFKSRIDLVRPAEKNGEAQPEQQEVVADWGGIVGDLELKPGKYTGAENMPLLLKNRSSYEVYLNSPYSEKFDSCLSVRLAYPFDANIDFLKLFKDNCLSFEGGLETK